MTRGDRSPRDLAEATFDLELGRAARSLVSEPLPRGVLDHLAPVDSRRTSLRVGASLVAAAVIAATGLTLAWALVAPPTGPGRPGPLQGPTRIERELEGGGYTCQLEPRPSLPVARPEALVCNAPATLHPVAGAIIVGEDASGSVASIKIKSGVLTTSNASLEATVEIVLERLIGTAFATSEDRAAARAWLRAAVPIAAGTDASTSIAGLRVVLERMSTGGYEILIGSAAEASPTASR